MATLTQTETVSVPAPNVLGFLTGIVRFFESVAAAHQAARDFDRLNGRSDASLAREGLTRADAPAAIMKRHFG